MGTKVTRTNSPGPGLNGDPPLTTRPRVVSWLEPQPAATKARAAAKNPIERMSPAPGARLRAKGEDGVRGKRGPTAEVFGDFGGPTGGPLGPAGRVSPTRC